MNGQELIFSHGNSLYQNLMIEARQHGSRCMYFRSQSFHINRNDKEASAATSRTFPELELDMLGFTAQGIALKSTTRFPCHKKRANKHYIRRSLIAISTTNLIIAIAGHD